MVNIDSTEELTLMGKVDFEGVLLERTKLESLNTNDRAKNDRIKLNFPGHTGPKHKMQP